ncbi:MAG: nodulation protein NfeD [Dysgonamonadaceae bacterium]|jgi:membrane-bound serine protease (ClpP class)|nr:nodulation protein NfeD [Dysgonamonadaceae bacterium]
MKKRFFPAIVLLLFCFFFSESAKSDDALLYKIDIKTDINPTSRICLDKGLREAKVKKAEAVLLHLNTYGGTVVDADSMRSAILYNQIPVYVFIDNNAASAGALIAIACKKIYMRRGANIGAATVVNGQSGEAMPDKYQSYMRSIIRSTAESHGKKTIFDGKDSVQQWVRDPRIAEAMVDETIYIPNISDSGKVLTLTASEAVRYGFCDGIAETVEDVVRDLGYDRYRIEEYRPSLADLLKGFLMNPAFQAILIMIIVAGIYFELQTPGIGFPSLAAIVAAILYFTPLYIDGLVQNWELIIFLAGIILIILEIFIFPGFGISGILGITFIFGGLIFALLNNDYFTFDEVLVPDISVSLLTVVAGILMAIILCLWMSMRIGERGLFRKVALLADLESANSADPAKAALAGKIGVAATVLRPSGRVLIDGDLYDAVSIIGYIEAGEEVKVVRSENMQLYIEKV